MSENLFVFLVNHNVMPVLIQLCHIIYFVIQDFFFFFILHLKSELKMKTCAAMYV